MNSLFVTIVPLVATHSTAVELVVTNATPYITPLTEVLINEIVWLYLYMASQTNAVTCCYVGSRYIYTSITLFRNKLLVKYKKGTGVGFIGHFELVG